MIDTHAHLHDPTFDADRADVVRRAVAAGLSNIVNVGCDLDDSARAVAIANEFGLAASVGMHPHAAKNAPHDLKTRLGSLGRSSPRVLAIGETGLDYHYDNSPREAQLRIFREQLELAAELDLPLIFHQREAFDDFLEVVRDRHKMRGVVHCFTGNSEQARTCVQEFGFYLGIGGVLTFKTAQDLRDAVRAVGIEKLILETDCPFLAPVPHRGKRNEPAFLADTARAVAAVLGVSVAELSERTTHNAVDLFGPLLEERVGGPPASSPQNA